jgi:hypothetical protein
VNFSYEVSLFVPVRLFNMLQNLTAWDRRLYVPSEGSCDRILSPLKSIALGRV